VTAPRDHDGLLIDAGGVLTSDIFTAFDAHCERIGLEGFSFRELYFGSPDAQALLHRLEIGDIDADTAEPELARLLGVEGERAHELFEGLHQDVAYVSEMTDAVETLRDRGIRTGLLSNSWWYPFYETPLFARAFDVKLISGRVGIRKPHRAIFEQGVDALGVAPERIVFVDDFEENLAPARELGMTVILHDPVAPQATLAELERLFGVDLLAR
jgi:epoxide hydrolase-like predicted phosphatase